MNPEGIKGISSEIKYRTIPLWTIPETEVHFSILKNGEPAVPAVGAKVTLCTKGVVPATFTKTVDMDGIATFKAGEIVPEIGAKPEVFKQIPWLLTAYMEDSEFGTWKDQAFFELGKAHTFVLKKYEKVPTFFIKIELRDIIGVEHFSNLVAEIEKRALETAGLEVVKVKGQGTRTVEVQFKPPWHESPIVIAWATVWFILKVLTVAAAIIAVLVVLKWTFGRVTPAVVGAGLGAVALLALAALAPKKPKIPEVKRR